MIWPTKTLGDIAADAGGEVRTGPFGSQLHKHDYVETQSATPVVMPKDMVEGRIDTSSIARIDDMTRERLSAHILMPGDIVLGRRGEIGRRAWVGDRENGWLCGTGSMRISIRNSHEVIPRYLYYFLELPSTIGWLRGHSVGATMSNLSAGVVQQMPVTYPSIDVQQAIIDALDNFETLVKNNRWRIEILEELARLLYREWFVHFRFPGHEDVELVDSELGPIPGNWTISQLGDEVTLKRQNIMPHEYADEEFDHYSIPAFDANRRPSVDPGVDIRSGKYLLTDQSILVSKLNPRIPRIWRADTTMGNRRAVASTEFLVLTEPSPWSLVFVYGLVSSTEFTNALASTAGGTSTSHQRVKPADVLATAVLRPPLKLVEMYTEAVEPLLSLADVLLRQVEVVREVRDLLLPRLVSGELNVSELDLDLEAMGL